MKHVSRASALVLLALIGCGDGPSRSQSTEATTRSLLGGTQMGGGPSTLVREMSGLTNGLETVSVADFGYNRGSPDALLKVIEFSDFGCGYCLRFHQESFAALKEQFIDTGIIEWKFMPFITGAFENSLTVTEAAECALEQSPVFYEEVGGELWARQREWKESDEPDALVREWAREAGVDVARFDSCLAEDRRMRRVAGATSVATQLGVRATPTIWVVGFGPIQGALPLSSFQGILAAVYEELVAGAEAAPAQPPAN